MAFGHEVFHEVEVKELFVRDWNGTAWHERCEVV
jgi:hypothetical protein